MMQADFPSLATPARGFVFVVSFGMSGDVALQGLMNRMAGVCIRGENAGVINNIADAWQAAAERGGHDLQAFRDLNRLGWHLADAFAEAVLVPPKGGQYAGFREIRWSDEADEFRRRLDFLYAFFPGARFVFHTRDPGDVAELGWWAEQPTADVVASLTRRCGLYQAYLSDHPARGILLDHDTYIQDSSALKPLFDMLETPFSELMAADWIREQQA